MEQEKQDVLAAFEQWLAAVQKRDVEAVVALYAKDAVLWGTVSPYLRTTPKQIKAYFKYFLSLPNLRALYHHEYIRIYGDIAINDGYYTFFSEDERGMDHTPARYSFVYQRQENGDWLIIDHHSSATPSSGKK